MLGTNARNLVEQQTLTSRSNPCNDEPGVTANQWLMLKIRSMESSVAGLLADVGRESHYGLIWHGV